MEATRSSSNMWISVSQKLCGRYGPDVGYVLGKAENLTMSYLRINKNGKLIRDSIQHTCIQAPRIGSVPTLVVPLEKTLGPDDDHRFKAVLETRVCRSVHSPCLHRQYSLYRKS